MWLVLWKQGTWAQTTPYRKTGHSETACDRILENLPFGHIGQSDPYLLGKRGFWCEASQQEGLIVALSKCAKKLDLKNTSYRIQICDRILENLPFGHKQTFEKTQLKIFTVVYSQLNV